MTTIKRDPIHRSTEGINPTAGAHVTPAPLDLEAIAEWTARNALVRRHYHQQRARMELADWATAHGFKAKKDHFTLAAVQAYEAAGLEVATR
jgi:hypothetical protein